MSTPLRLLRIVLTVLIVAAVLAVVAMAVVAMALARTDDALPEWTQCEWVCT